MTITSEIAYTDTLGDGSTGPYNIGFVIISENNIEVFTTVVATGVSTKLELTSDYTVSSDLTTITLTASISSAVNLRIKRDTPFLQPYKLLNNSVLPASRLELSFDNMIEQVQELNFFTERMVRMNISTPTIDSEIPPLIKNRILVVDENAGGIGLSSFSLGGLDLAQQAINEEGIDTFLDAADDIEALVTIADDLSTTADAAQDIEDLADQNTNINTLEAISDDIEDIATPELLTAIAGSASAINSGVPLKNRVWNGDFKVWDRPIPVVVTDPASDRARPLAGWSFNRGLTEAKDNTCSRVVGNINRYALRVKRDEDVTDVGRLVFNLTKDATRDLRGETIVVGFHVRTGPNYSGDMVFRVFQTTRDTSDFENTTNRDSGEYAASGSPTNTTLATVTPTTAWTYYTYTFTVPANSANIAIVVEDGYDNAIDPDDYWEVDRAFVVKGSDLSSRPQTTNYAEALLEAKQYYMSTYDCGEEGATEVGQAAFVRSESTTGSGGLTSRPLIVGFTFSTTPILASAEGIVYSPDTAATFVTYDVDSDTDRGPVSITTTDNYEVLNYSSQQTILYNKNTYHYTIDRGI